jgi:hypothetical protein
MEPRHVAVGLLLLCLLAPPAHAAANDPQDMVTVVGKNPPPSKSPPRMPPPPKQKLVVSVDGDSTTVEVAVPKPAPSANATGNATSNSNSTGPTVVVNDPDVVVNKEVKQCDVLIIGAGMAGMAAGWKLKGYGNRVIILEGRNRIGGRVSARPPALELRARLEGAGPPAAGSGRGPTCPGGAGGAPAAAWAGPLAGLCRAT